MSGYSLHMHGRSSIYWQSDQTHEDTGLKVCFVRVFFSGVVYTLYIRYNELAEPFGEHTRGGYLALHAQA